MRELYLFCLDLPSLLAPPFSAMAFQPCLFLYPRFCNSEWLQLHNPSDIGQILGYLSPVIGARSASPRPSLMIGCCATDTNHEYARRGDLDAARFMSLRLRLSHEWESAVKHAFELHYFSDEYTRESRGRQRASFSVDYWNHPGE